MSDIAAAFMNALGIGKKKPVAPVLSAEEEAAPWNVSQGGQPQGGGATHTMPDGSEMSGPTHPGAPAPPSRLDDIDALLMEIKKQKQRAAALGGSPVPR